MAEPERDSERSWFDEEEPSELQEEVLGPVEPSGEGELPQEMRRISEGPMVLAVIGVGVAIMLLWYALEWSRLGQLGGALSGPDSIWGQTFHAPAAAPAPSMETARPSLPVLPAGGAMNRGAESVDVWLAGVVREAPMAAPERMALPAAPMMSSPPPRPEPTYREPQMPISSEITR